MSAADPTPLQALAPWPGLPPLFLKREDLLRHGGGAKVRRFQAHFAGPAIQDPRPVVVLSERGAHSFLTLARMSRDGALNRPLLLLERSAARTPYAERNRAETLAVPGVRVVEGALPSLLLRLAWLKCRPARYEVLGLGGQTPGGVAAAKAAYREAHGQLAELDPPAGRTWHLLAAASGTLAEGLLAGLRDGGARHEGLLVVPTGPAGVRGRLRRRLGSDPRVRVLPSPVLPWADAVEASHAFHRHSGVWLDPRHALRAWLAVTSPHVGPLSAADRVVLWVTGPLLADAGAVASGGPMQAKG